MTSPYSPQARLSDADRAEALNQLAQAVGEGRLTITEFEQRSDDVVQALTRAQLLPILSDIPSTHGTEIKTYTQEDINRARQAARRPRLATALIGTAGLTFTAIAAGSVGSTLGVSAALFLIPVLWVLLYVAKMGPASWNMPSARQIERQAHREIRVNMALQRAQQKELESQMWAQRRQQAGEVAGDAINFAKRKFTEWNGR